MPLPSSDMPDYLSDTFMTSLSPGISSSNINLCTAECRADIEWWVTFIQQWNGVSIYRKLGAVHPDVILDSINGTILGKLLHRKARHHFLLLSTQHISESSVSHRTFGGLDSFGTCPAKTSTQGFGFMFDLDEFCHSSAVQGLQVALGLQPGCVRMGEGCLYYVESCRKLHNNWTSKLLEQFT